MNPIKYLKSIRNQLLQNFLQTRLFRKCEAPKTMRLASDVKWITINCGDHIITCSPHENIGKAIYKTGHYQRDLTDAAVNEFSKRGLLKDGVVLEFGANIGTQSVYLMLTKKFKGIICVEPDPKNIQLLERNLRDNGLESKATVIAAAAGDRDGMVNLNLFEHNHGRNSIVVGSPTGKSISVPMLSFNSILQRAKIQPQDVAFIWMDIEGAEPIVCQTISELLELRVPIAMEYTPAAYGVEMAGKFIDQLGKYYRTYLTIDSTTCIEQKICDLPTKGEQLNILLLP